MSVHVFAATIAYITLSCCNALAQGPSPEEVFQDFWSKIGTADSFHFRLSQATVSRLGKTVLPQMAKSLDKAEPRQQDALKELVAMMLIRSVDIAEMEKFPKLLHLMEKETIEVDKLITLLESTNQFDSLALVKTDIPDQGAYANPQLRQAISDLSNKYAGYSIPSIVRLAKTSNNPIARFYAGNSLLRQAADGQIETLLYLIRDTTRIKYKSIDTNVTFEIGQEILSKLPHRFRATPIILASYEAEAYLLCLDRFQRPDLPDHAMGTFPLANNIRSTTKAFYAESWREYWERAEPAIQSSWKEPSKP